MKDRLVEYPNRFKLRKENGSSETITLEAMPGFIEEAGTPLSKGTLLSDKTAKEIERRTDKNPNTVNEALLEIMRIASTGYNSYFEFIKNESIDLIDAAFGKNNEKIISLIGLQLNMYLKFCGIDKISNELISCDKWSDVLKNDQAILFITKYPELMKLILSSPYAIMPTEFKKINNEAKAGGGKIIKPFIIYKYNTYYYSMFTKGNQKIIAKTTDITAEEWEIVVENFTQKYKFESIKLCETPRGKEFYSVEGINDGSGVWTTGVLHKVSFDTFESEEVKTFTIQNLVNRIIPHEKSKGIYVSGISTMNYINLENFNVNTLEANEQQLQGHLNNNGIYFSKQKFYGKNEDPKLATQYLFDDGITEVTTVPAVLDLGGTMFIATGKVNDKTEIVSIDIDNNKVSKTGMSVNDIEAIMIPPWGFGIGKDLFTIPGLQKIKAREGYVINIVGHNFNNNNLIKVVKNKDEAYLCEYKI